MIVNKEQEEKEACDKQAGHDVREGEGLQDLQKVNDFLLELSC